MGGPAADQDYSGESDGLEHDNGAEQAELSALEEDPETSHSPEAHGHVRMSQQVCPKGTLPIGHTSSTPAERRAGAMASADFVHAPGAVLLAHDWLSGTQTGCSASGLCGVPQQVRLLRTITGRLRFECSAVLASPPSLMQAEEELQLSSDEDGPAFPPQPTPPGQAHQQHAHPAQERQQQAPQPQAAQPALQGPASAGLPYRAQPGQPHASHSHPGGAPAGQPHAAAFRSHAPSYPPSLPSSSTALPSFPASAGYPAANGGLVGRQALQHHQPQQQAHDWPGSAQPGLAQAPHSYAQQAAMSSYPQQAGGHAPALHQPGGLAAASAGYPRAGARAAALTGTVMLEQLQCLSIVEVSG